MKKLLIAAFVLAAFGLVGCAQDKSVSAAPDTVSGVAQVKHTKHVKHHSKGKLGVEKTTVDVAK